MKILAKEGTSSSENYYEIFFNLKQNLLLKYWFKTRDDKNQSTSSH